MTASPQFQAIDGRGLAVTFDRKTGKLILPAMSEHDDLHRLCDWLTVVFALDPSHPITGGKRTGDPRPDRRARLTRAGAPALAFEPVAHISQAARLIDALAWQTIPTDMDALCWARVPLSGYSQFGREGRRTGRHVRCNAWPEGMGRNTGSRPLSVGQRCEHVFVTSQGSPYARFQRALATGNLLLIRAAAAELPRVDLSDALSVCVAIRQAAPERFERAALRWLARFCVERPGATLDDVRAAAWAFERMGSDPDGAMSTLRALAR